MKNEPDGRVMDRKPNGNWGETLDQLFIYTKESEILKAVEENIKRKYKF